MGGKRVFELMLEIGHKSSPLNKKLTNGYTHKWTAFVRGVDNSRIEHCIQRVVFHLHESFDNSTRVISEPPYQIKETGYAGFEIPIQIHFKNKEKPNHLTFVHDLCLLTNKPNDASTVEKIKFINPNREFEKCLIKSGAQLLSVSVKKERSDSPPAKKQKSSSLIPSKDMNKQPLPLPQSQHQPTPHHHHHHHHQKPSQQSQNHHTNNHHPKHQNHHHQKAESSKDFIDLFGAPLVYNSQLNSKETIPKESISRETLTREPISREPISREPPIKDSSSRESLVRESVSREISSRETVTREAPIREPIARDLASSRETLSRDAASREFSSKEHHHNKHTPIIKEELSKEDQFANDLQLIQTKISCLSDCDRLQKIVDIVEEAGEWYNLTSKKFEFDLKRLDRKTLSRIEKCLS